MNIQNVFIPVSGTLLGDSERSVQAVMLVAQSGNTFVPVKISDLK